MLVRNVLFILLLAATTVLLIGCGKEQTGSAQLSVLWPMAPTAELGKVQSITVVIFHNKKTIAVRMFNRPIDGSVSLLQVDGVPVASYSYLATAYPGADGQGEALGMMNGTVQIEQTRITRLTIATEAAPHATLSISPESRTVTINDHCTFAARLVNPDGNPVILPANSQRWSIDNTQVATIPPW